MNPSPILLRKMGVKFARSILSCENLQPEAKLWRSVVVNAVEDCLIDHSDRKSSLLKIYSHNWILNRTKDFNYVCAWGELDPDDIEECYKKAIESGEIKFTNKQSMWFAYDKVYKRMLQAESFEKKNLRKKINNLRGHIKQTANFYMSTIFVTVFV